MWLWRLRISVPWSAVGKLETQESLWYSYSVCLKAWEPGEPISSSSKACMLKTQEKPLFQTESEGRKRLPSSRQSGRRSLLLGGVSAFLFYSSLQWIAWGPPISGKAICFTQFPDSNVNLIPSDLQRHIQNNIWWNFWAPCGKFKLTHKINQSHRPKKEAPGPDGFTGEFWPNIYERNANNSLQYLWANRSRVDNF